MGPASALAHHSATMYESEKTVTARPRRDGRPAGARVSVTKLDGTVLAPRPLVVRVSIPPN